MELSARATADERELLRRHRGELRTGVSEGLVLEAIAEAAGGAPSRGAPRRAVPAI